VIRIFTPTYGRVKDQKSLKTLHPALHKLVTLFARESEAKEIRQEVKTLAGTETPASVVVLPPEYTKDGYISAMQYLFEYAGTEPFIYMDDDITALQRTIRFDKKATKEQRQQVEEQSRWAASVLSTPEEQLELLQAIIDEVHEPFVATCSPKPPHIQPAGRLMRKNGIMIAQHTVMFVAFNTARIKEAGIEWGKHRGKDCHNAISDMQFNLQLLNAGLDCRYNCRYSFRAVPMFAGSGGINHDEGEEARKQRVIDAHAQLAELFPMACKERVQVTRVRKNPTIKIPYIFQRAKFLKLVRQDLDPAGMIYPPEDHTKLLEDWTAWGPLKNRDHLWTRPEDEQLHKDARKAETALYKKQLKDWNKKHRS
jgi:hypothetical protein